MYMHNNHCHRATAHLQFIIIIIIIIIIMYCSVTGNISRNCIWNFIEALRRINEVKLKHVCKFVDN